MVIPLKAGPHKGISRASLTNVPHILYVLSAIDPSSRGF
jgi:hypothetical protein